MRTWEGEGEFRELLAADEELKTALSSRRLAECFDPQRLLRHVDRIFERLFGG